MSFFSQSRVDEDVLLHDIVDTEDLKKHEALYHQQLQKGRVDEVVQWEYAWCLIRSKYTADIRRGCLLLEELHKTGRSADAKRDYLYYLAVGSAKLKEYKEALGYLDSLLQKEPANQQAKALKALVKKKQDMENIKSAAAVGGGVLALGAVVGLGMALARR